RIPGLAKELHIPLVATNDCHDLRKDHSEAHEILICLQTGKNIKNRARRRYPTPEFYFKSGEEMYSLFRDIPEALENTAHIAESCNLDIDLNRLHMPLFPIPESETHIGLEEYLRKLAEEGLKKRYSKITREIKERFEHEIKIINNMGFAGYFLIVQDFIKYAKDRGIPVGPGRGSAAGSLITYALGITDIDPLKYNLLFERFLNPERISMPDIDIDFCYERRGEVIDYIKKRYGNNSVTQIITFGKLKARAVIRDVGRVLNMSYGEVDRIAKLVPPGPRVTLDLALEIVPELKEIQNMDEIHTKLIEHSKVLEGLSRHASTHAAGVVIAPGELTDFVPLYKSPQDEVTTQYDMKILDMVGLLKMDFLGLRTLTVIDNTLKMLKNKGIELNIDEIPLDDPKVYELFSSGNTIGIFQFESAGMRECLRKLKPNCLDDLIAMNALYRPGPMRMIDDYIARKHGMRKIDYTHPSLEPILKETYGIIVYQEQVMQIASEIAGFSLSKADIMRRAMGKKQKEIMRRQKKEFIKGAMAHGISRKKAQDIFDLIVKFAEYGFNKSHSTAYSIVAYRTAYLKVYYPAEFMAAILSSEMSDTDRIVVLLNECKKLGLEVLPPDVNESDVKFSADGKVIKFALAAIKNVGSKAVESIVMAREKHGKFKTIFDMCKHLDLRLVNKKVMESLIFAGALDSLEGTRPQKFKMVEAALSYAQRYQGERDRGQTNIFDMEDSERGTFHLDQPKLPQEKDWRRYEKLSKEKEVLGFYLTGHPLSKYQDELYAFTNYNHDQVNNFYYNKEIRAGGIITDVKIHFDKKNKQMAFCTLEGFGGSTEVLIFSDIFSKYKSILNVDEMIMVKGKISKRDEDRIKIIAEEIIPLSQVREKFTRKLCFFLDTSEVTSQQIENVKDLFEKYRGNCRLIFHVKSPEFGSAKLISKKLKVSPDPELLKTLRETYGEDCVWLG
ncbi:MAG: DNA polymerase III subunit alpha, partial [Fidelibacterota bacterium]